MEAGNFFRNQNQGIEIATGEYLFFLNNDLTVSPGWDARLIETAKRHEVDIISGCGIENMGTPAETQSVARKWKRCKNLLSPLGFGQRNLLFMHWMMYGNWETFCEKRFHAFEHQVMEGIVGNNVMMTKKAIQTMGLWDERIQAADFDLFIRSKKRSLETGDIKPCHIDLGVYIHHFIRMTVKYAVKPKPFTDSANLISLADKWSAEELKALSPKDAV
ncbi:nucleotide-diphospho-sugar transferase [Russula earlei]|uniref:Nucleotide-diphospho-sugar transferase n=1 Tax=Russula earlei TaxID=71964 RepID=A0ACC0TQD1_9AGAM|nr:nucleotide-diphospho-sugar transferase [Russula earlei]